MIILSLASLLILIMALISFIYARKIPPLVLEINEILSRLSHTAVGGIPINRSNLLKIGNELTKNKAAETSSAKIAEKAQIDENKAATN